MREDKNVFDRIKERGEEVLTQVSAELMSNPAFTKAVEGAMRGKEMAEEAVGKALKGMNLPTRTDLKKALHRIETLEAEIAALKKKVGAAGKAAKPAAASSKAKKKR